MSNNIATLAAELTVNANPFVEGMKNAGEHVEEFTGKVETAKKSLGPYIALLEVVGGVALAEFVHSSMEAVDVQAQIARSVGATTGGFQALSEAAKMANISQDMLSQTAGKLNNKIGEAILKGGESAKVFESLGLNVRALAGMDADQRFIAVGDAINRVGLNSTAAGYALKEMGIKSNEMREFIMFGAEDIKTSAMEIESYGVKLSNIDSTKIEMANDELDKLGLITKGIGNQLSVAVSPFVREFAEQILHATENSKGFKQEIHDALEQTFQWVGAFEDIWRGIEVVFAGLKVGVSSFIDVGIVGFTLLAETIAKSMDGWVMGANLAIQSSNELLGTNLKLLDLPSNSKFMEGLSDNTTEELAATQKLKDEFQALAMQEMPSAGLQHWFEETMHHMDELAAKTDEERKHLNDLGETLPAKPAKPERDNHAGDILAGLNSGTIALQAELDKRNAIHQIYLDHQISANDSYYKQELQQIEIQEKIKEADILDKTTKDAARRDEQRVKNLERVAGDNDAIAAINEQYSKQEILAEKIKQSELTKVQDEAQRARDKLRKAEMHNAISTALGLGQQLMTVTQGHSKQGFEIAKKAALASAGVAGVLSAVEAWRSGMQVPGPWAPAVAAAYTAASLLKTGAMIQSIQSQQYNGGGSGSVSASAAGGDFAAAQNTARQNPAPNAGSVMDIRGIGPHDFVNGTMMESIVMGVSQYAKDGGTVRWAHG